MDPWGGFSVGTGSSYYGRYGVPLVAVGQDVVIVTLNYRLMVWGVFNTGLYHYKLIILSTVGSEFLPEE